MVDETFGRVYDTGPYEGIRSCIGMDELPESPVKNERRGIWSPHCGWYIQMGFSGYNSPTNNKCGYKTEKSALAAIRRYQAAGERSRS